MYKKAAMTLSVLGITLLPFAASAHISVSPKQVGVGAYQTFTFGVPNEKDQPVTGLRIVIPEGQQDVSVTSKPGWTIMPKYRGANATSGIAEISWTGGSIPVGQRDEFGFSTQVPAKEGTLIWKAYQTYADGTVVAWNQAPSDKSDEESTPYPLTMVVNDLAAASASAASLGANQTPAALLLSVLAIAVASVAGRTAVGDRPGPARRTAPVRGAPDRSSAG